MVVFAYICGEELKYVQEAFDSNWIAPLGPLVNQFEERLSTKVGMAHCAALSSGTAAIHLALIILGVKEGDEVMVQSFTFCGSANPVLYQKAKPIFIDSERETWNMDPDLLDKAIQDRIQESGKKPKAVIAVHLYGMPCQIDHIQQVCRKYDIPLIEDAAEALGSTYKGKPLGSFGDFSVLSFNGNKIITTSGGGALLANRADWITKARLLSTQAREDVVHYEHHELGFNYRISNVLAGVGLGQLDCLDEWVSLRNANHAFYQAIFNESGVVVHEVPSDDYFSNHWLTCVTIDAEKTGFSREDVRLALQEENIESRPLWKPMHQQPLYKDAVMYGGAVCDHLFDTGLCLPSGSNLSDKEKERINQVLNKFVIQ